VTWDDFRDVTALSVLGGGFVKGAILPFQVVHCTLDTGTSLLNQGDSWPVNAMKNCLRLVCMLVCLAITALSQQTATVVGTKPGSALHAQKASGTAQKLETSSLHISCDSVEEVLITDPMGRRLGDNPANNAHYDEIPNAYFEAGGTDDDETGDADDNPAKILFIPTPASGDYKLTIFLGETDHYSCELLAYDNAGKTSSAELKDDAAKSGDTPRFTISFSGAPGSKIRAVSTAR
jgi:hypothetical protein